MNALAAPLRYILFMGRSLIVPWDVSRTWPRLTNQCYVQGVGALPIILLAGVFVGLTTAVQTNYQLMGVVPKYFVGMGVGRIVLIELAPVFTAFIVAGRAASSFAAELGSMRVSNQIDALTVMGINPYRFLCLPRIVALMVVTPVLVVLMELAAIVVALGISSKALDVPAYTFMYGVTHFFLPQDFFGGLGKAALFGLVVGTSGCFCGFGVQGGAEQVGRAATRAVVVSSILILMFNFVVAIAFFNP